MRKTRVAVLISGRGSNMAALIEAAKAPDYPAKIALVISNKADALGLEKARAAGVPVIVVESRPFKGDREAFERALDAEIGKHAIDLICLAGFMRIFSPWFTTRWAGKMINIHPSLLPKHKGLDTHARAIAAGDAEHGASVHWVTPDLDDGPVILQAKVPLLAGDTPEALASRVIAVEHGLYVEALRRVAAGGTR